MAAAAIIAALGGAQGLVVLLNSLATVLFSVWKLANQIAGKEAIPTWEQLTEKNRLEAEAIENDKAEMQGVIDRLTAELNK